ncbi:hypothetical protein SAMN05444580_101215 [Rhodococcus tukisamuensis]|uniref:Uncharacterized protein n=1 Tax=Rhodococcus tukisamuensis TaxID=168276 RepID=A0A1G6ML57_9NOCA|nr:hypothetical protein SAMN05444580_101215 [Rhodococcus tukisamuensis]
MKGTGRRNRSSVFAAALSGSVISATNVSVPGVALAGWFIAGLIALMWLYVTVRDQLIHRPPPVAPD